MLLPEVIVQSQKELRLSANAALKKKKKKENYGLAQQHTDARSQRQERINEVSQPACTELQPYNEQQRP